MNTFDVTTLPEIDFYHEHEAATYTKIFPRTQGIIEISHVTRGHLTLEQDGERFYVNAGDVCCFIHNKETRIFSPTPHCHRTVCARIQWEETEGLGGFVLPLVTPACPGTQEICDLIDDFIDKPYHYENTKGKGAAAFLNILDKIDKVNRTAAQFHRPEGDLVVMRAKKYIHKNIHAPISQARVAEHLKVTPQYLCHVFKKSEGVSLIKYTNRIKLENIQLVMEKENLKLYEAAQRFGFTDANYVSYLYKKTFGKTITGKEPY